MILQIENEQQFDQITLDDAPAITIIINTQPSIILNI
jgi:hypothetical protein